MLLSRLARSALAALALSLARVDASLAGDLSVSLSTLFRAYDYVDLDGETVEFRALTPTVVASATDLLGRDFAFVANARRIESFTDNQDDRNDLLYAILSWHDPRSRVSLEAGRLVRAQGPGYTRFDGLRGSYRFGQFQVGGSFGFGFERDGRDHAQGRYSGAELSWRPSSRATFSGAVERGTDEGTEYLYKYAADAMLKPARAVTLRGSFLWNAAVDELDEVMASGEWQIANTRLSAEGGRIHPHFDPDSIWNVFNSGPYDRVQLRLSQRFASEREIWARWERRRYHDQLAGNAGSAEPDFRSSNDALSVGFGNNGSPGLRHAAEMFLYTGFGGFRAGASLRLGTELGFVPGRIDGGVDFRAYDRAFRDSRQDLTTAFWAETLFRLGRYARLRLRAEDYKNGYLLDDFRLTLKLDLASAEEFR